MKAEVPVQIRMSDRKMLFAVFVNRVDRFHAHVESENKIIEIQSHPQSVGHCYLFVKLIKLELPSRLLSVVSQCPYIAGIDEEGTVELPEEYGSVFQVQVQLHVAGLIDEIDSTVVAFKFARSESSHAPSSYRVGTS